MFLHDIVAPLTIDEAKATKTRLDPKCWAGKKIGNPKTKVKGGVRVNNCVPKESVNEAQRKRPLPKFTAYPSYHDWRLELSRRGDDQIDHLDNDYVDNYRVLFAVDRNRQVVGMYYHTADSGSFVPPGQGFSDMIYYASSDPNWPYDGDDGKEDLQELSKDTLGSYAKKSADDLDISSYMAGRGGEDEDYLKSMKRKEGIKKAIDRLTAQQTQKKKKGIKEVRAGVDDTDTVGFSVNSEAAYNAVMRRFGDYIDHDETSGVMYTPARVWPQIEMTAFDADPDEGAVRIEDDVMEQGVSEGSDNTFVITAKTAEGPRKQFRVRAQSERAAIEKFTLHHNQAEILKVSQEATPFGNADDMMKNLKISEQGAAGEQDIPDLENVGQPVKSIMDAERRMAAGDRIFVAHEMDEEPFEIFNVGDLQGYTYDQILVVPQGVAEQYDPATAAIWIDQVSQLAQSISQLSPEELVKLNDAFQNLYRVAGGAAAGAASAGIGGMFYSLLKDTLYAAKRKARVDTDEILQLKRQIVSIHKRLKTLKSEPAIAKYQAMLKQAYKVLEELEARRGNRVAEGKGLARRVRVVKTGETGTIRQIKHGAYKGAPKTYYVDLDNGGQADNLPARALRLIKGEVAEADRNEMDTPEFQAAIAKMKKRHAQDDQNFNLDKARELGKKLAARGAAERKTKGVDEDSWHDGQNAWSSDKNQWSNESVENRRLNRLIEYRLAEMRRAGYNI